MIFDLRGKVVKAKFLTPKIKFVKVELLGDFEFKSGQFVNVEVAPNFYRSYSICSPSFDPKHLEFVVDITPGGKGSQFFEKLKNGAEMHFKGPFGELVLQGSVDSDLYFVATGTGVAPFRAMTFDLEKREYLMKRRVTLCWGLRYKEDIYFREEFDKLSNKYPNFKYSITLSKPEDWFGECGYVTKHMEEEGIDTTKSLFYICGNQQMIGDVKNLLIAKGATSDQIFFEKFF